MTRVLCLCTEVH